jgi:hypothetical protein
VAIARSCIRARARGRFHTAVDLVNRLEAEARAGRHGRIADQLARLDFLVLDELGYLPFAQLFGSSPYAVPQPPRHPPRAAFLSSAWRRPTIGPRLIRCRPQIRRRRRGSHSMRQLATR